MFATTRHLFHRRSPAPETTPGDAATRPVSREKRSALHPAMRGLNVSSVHGRHCICDRCSSDRAA